MFGFPKFKSALSRWLGQSDHAPHPSPPPPSDTPRAESDEEAVNQRLTAFLRSFLDQDRNSLGKVRLINLETVRERVGCSWPKLSGKVELLTAKIIRDKLGLRDSYLRIGEGEFLIFFSDASAAEAKIRCLAIVETLQQKLFAESQPSKPGAARAAECHIAREVQLSGMRDSAKVNAGMDAGHAFGKMFSTEAEVLDGVDLATNIQIALDTIIGRASESRTRGELDPLGTRLKFLARDLGTLKPSIDLQEVETSRRSLVARSLREAEKDATDLISVIEMDSGISHAKVLEVLEKLKSERAERVLNLAAEDDLCSSQPDERERDPKEFEYVPVYRSVSQGEKIYKGIYRIAFRDKTLQTDDRRRSHLTAQKYTDRQHQQWAARERVLLQQAIKYCWDQAATADFVLLVPVHVATLDRPYLQRRYATIVRGIPAHCRRRLIIEIVGYRETDDTIALRRAIDEIRLHAQGIFVTQFYGEVVNANLALEACKRLGAHAVGMDFSNCQETEARMVAALSQFAQCARTHGIAAYVDGIATPAVVLKALAAGTSYFCAPALVASEATPSNFGRTTLKELFWEVA